MWWLLVYDLIRANFHWSRNFDSSIELLLKVNGEAIYSTTGLINKTEMLSYPVEQSFRSWQLHVQS